jgi:hypothetical protein
MKNTNEPPAQTIKSPKADALSFISKRVEGVGYDYWKSADIPAPDHHFAGTFEGKRRANELVEFIHKHPTNFNVQLPVSIAHEQVSKGQWSTVETAFWQRISEYFAVACTLAPLKFPD